MDNHNVSHENQDAASFQPTKWDMCALCQKNTKEKLQCPANARQTNQGSTYVTLAKNLTKFGECGALSPDILTRLDDGDGVEETFMKKKASFHMSCRLKYNTTKLKRKLASCDPGEESVPAKKVTRREQRSSGDEVVDKDLSCFLCDKKAPAKDLRHASTFKVDERIRNCALILQESHLLAKLSRGDVIAQELKYHPACLTSLYRKAQPKVDCTDQRSDQIRKALVFAELTEYIEEVKHSSTGDNLKVLKLADLSKMYLSRLQEVGLETGCLHSSRLKTRLLAHFPDLQAHNSGRDILLTFTDSLNTTLQEAYAETIDDEAVHLAKAARIVRRDLFSLQARFNASCTEDVQNTSIPESLLALMQMILHGPSITSNKGKNQAALSLAQLASFNAVKTEGKRSRANTSTTNKHSKNREPPVPVYVGLTIHAQTRKKELVERMHSLGLSISYKRVLEISSELAAKACRQFQHDKVVCPMKLRHGLFTTAAVDNIDHNPSSTTSKDSFHGTAISLFQHPSEHCKGTERILSPELEVETISKTLSAAELPDFFTSIPPFLLKMPVEPPQPRNANVSTDNCRFTENGVLGDVLKQAISSELDWMEAVHSADTDCVSWGAFHASKSQQNDHTPGISSLLPLFHESSKSPAMMKHAMDLVMQAVKFLNPGQIPVITADQPLFAIAKQIQWKCPEFYGENKITLLLGGLHIEMSFLKTVGTLLKDSGWVEALVNAKVATSGCAESFLNGCHVTRTRRAHQLTACALFMLLKHAYRQYSLSCAALEENVLCFEDWKESMITTSPTFKYWTLVLQLEMILLVFVASLRDGNFTLYLQTLEELAPWFFALDQQNYGRWLSVHIHDMKKLQGGSSMCYEDLMQGRFVLQKTSRPFSKMALDQAHEQNNAMIKGEGGAVGLTENPSALRRWMIGGPEVSKVLQDLELSFEIKRSKESDQHHEQDKGFQENFKAAVCRLMDVIQETGNPFLEKSAELVTLHDNNIVNAAVHKTLSNIHKTGVAQYNEFMQERLVDMTKPVSAPIRRNNFILIAGAKRKKRSAPQYRISSLKSDCYLFSRLYVACQTRNGGLTDFFSYENQSAPPSLSCDGRMRLSNKSGLLECLEPLQTSSAVPTVTDMTILDGAAVVNMLRPGSAKTFADYANQVFIPYVMQTLQNVSHRLDVVWDCYRSDSLKAFTRERRGLEKRKRVTPETVLPSQWGSFLRVDANKTQLFAFLAQYLLTVQSEKLIVTTQGPDVISNKPIDHTNLSPCNHEEADTRMMLHLAHAAEHCRRILIRTVDTDVVVLSVAAMTRHPHLQLWIAMGAGKDFRYIAAHDISKVLGVAKAQCLPLFHSFTGCDTVSCFNGIGKKTAWEVWSKCDHVTDTFQKLCCAPFELTANDMSVLERFVTLLYDRGSNCHDVNSARKYMFTKTGRQIENIPPTSEALFQHCKRAIYQGGHIWSQAHERQPVLPDPSDWGWQFMDRQWQPFWTVLPQASLTCRELLKCACKKECRSKRCKCNKAGLKCTALCSCVCGADFPVQHPVQAFNTN